MSNKEDFKDGLAAEHVEELGPGTKETELAQISHVESAHETPMEALKRYPLTVVWIVYGIFIILTCAFDNSAAGSVVGLPRFRQDFGYAFEGNYVIPANWQSAWSGAPNASQVFGTFFGGWMSDKYGRRWVTLFCYVLLFIGITIETIANTTSNPNAVFFAGKFVNGWAIGGLIPTAMTYIGEISPDALRGIMMSAAAISFTVGGLILALIVNSYGNLPSVWAYKSCFVAQYGITGVAFLIWPLMPESPTWLLMQGREEQAAKAYERLGVRGDALIKKLAIVRVTLEESRRETEGASYLECFKKSNLRRTIVAAMPLTMQTFCGVYFVAGFLTYYMQLAGFSAQMSFKLGVVQQGLSMLGNITSWFLIDRLGRRTLTFWGLAILGAMMMIGAGLASTDKAPAVKAAIGFFITYCWLYNATIGATAYVAMAEIGTGRLRAKTAGLSLAFQQLWGTMWSFTLPFIFNPNAANLQAKTAFIFGGLSVLCCVYTFFYHPETKGRSYEELDEMFMKKIPARKFGTYVTDVEQKSQQFAMNENGMAQR